VLPSAPYLNLMSATKQIQAIAAGAKPLGNLPRFQDILFEAIRRLKDDPHGWGDPAYHKLVGGGVVCHAILRPIAFYFVIYESPRPVVLLEVRQFADFD
jgi:hypothetical protein